MGAGAALVGAGTVAASAAGAGAVAAGGITAAGALSAGTAALSAGASLLGGSRAAGGANAAAGLSEAQAAQNRADLLPYNTTGQKALGMIDNNLTSYGTPDRAYIDQANKYLGDAATLGSGPGAQAALENTPGYQFTRQQGLQAVQNSAAARGLGVSGAALKGAAAYATGLADQTYGDQFNKLLNLGTNSLAVNAASQGNLTNSYNRLLSTASLGESAAAQTGTTGATLTDQAGKALTGAGLADAAGTVGVGKAFTGAVKNYLSSDKLANDTAY